MTRRLLIPVCLFTSLLACSTSTSEHEAPATEAPKAMDLTAADLNAETDATSLVPSPLETQRALEAAGIETKLSTLIPNRTFDYKATDPDRAAVRTGVLLADMLLSVRTSSKKALLAQFTGLRRGMLQVQGGPDVDRTIADMQIRVRDDAVTRDKLLIEFDELVAAVIPELEFNGQARVLPLIQAGTWLEGSNLVTKAIRAKGKPELADRFLKQPAVVEYFTTYVNTEGSEKAPELVTQKLDASLGTLKKLAEKSEPLTDADLATVISLTDEVLALL